MKNIYELLSGIGIEIPEEKKTDFNKALAENYKTISEVENIKGKLAKAETERDEIKAKYDADISARDNDLDGLKKQLEDAGVDKTKLDDLTSKLASLQTDYDNAKTEYSKQLALQEYKYLVESSVNGLKFSSNSAKKAFVTDLTEKNLPVENGKLLGFDDYVNAYRESDAGAFVVEDNSANQNKPVIVSKSNNAEPQQNEGGDKPKTRPLVW